MDAIECIKTRRSVRAFQDRKVERNLIEEIVDVAAWIPSWKNTQPVKYIAIDDEQKIKYIADNMVIPFNKDTLYTAPVLFAVVVQRGKSGYENGVAATPYGNGYEYFDTGVAAQTFCLAAHSKGIGTVILGGIDAKAIKEYISLSDNDDVVVLIAAGYQNGDPFVMPRKNSKSLLKFI